MPSVRKTRAEGFLFAPACVWRIGRNYGSESADRGAVRFHRGSAVQHRWTVHQGDTLERNRHQRRAHRHRPGGHRGISGGHQAPAPSEPLDFPRGRVRVRHQPAVCGGQQAHHGGQHHRASVHRPYFRHCVLPALLAQAAQEAGPDRLRGGVRRGAVFLRGQPGDGGRPGQLPGPPVRGGLRRGLSDERHARQRRPLLGVLGGRSSPQ